MTKFNVGQVVKTTKGYPLETVGPVYLVIAQSKDMKRLWGKKEIHYLIKDNQTNEFTQVIERFLEKG